MLQHNATARRTHLAHAAVVGLHAICCGLPVLAVTAVAVSGAASGMVLLSSYVGWVHAFLHGHELWLVGISATLVATGGILEASMRRGGARHGFPWLYAISAACLIANLAILAFHRGL